MNRRELTFSCALLFASVGCSASGAGQGRTLAPMELYGIEPGMKLDAVTARLGQPMERIDSEGFIVRRLSYPKVVVGFDRSGVVSEIESKSKDACLLREICPGSSLVAMQRELAVGRYKAFLEGDTLEIQGDGCWGEVRISRGLAKSVVVLCSP